ncbi:MAG: hypothetical protein SFT81_05910 [Candidatus Caenarcaniphilales bacterium]|nr:hypothetical protein [Candidatus Caenarcaniphilales bacterium]
MNKTESPLSLSIEKTTEALLIWFDYPGMQGQIVLSLDDGEAFRGWLKDISKNMPSIGIPLPGSTHKDTFLPDTKPVVEAHYGFRSGVDEDFSALLFFDVEYGQACLELKLGKYSQVSFLGEQVQQWLEAAEGVIDYAKP